MRHSVFLALLVVAFVASCSCVTSAENVAQVKDNNSDGHLKGSRKLATADEWWLSEERLSTSLLSKLKGKIRSIRPNPASVKTQSLSGKQFKSISTSVAKTVKKDRKTWPIIKKGLKIVYGSLLASLIILSVDAMLYL